jgi:membrane-associated phospholipid phosphatase
MPVMRGAPPPTAPDPPPPPVSRKKQSRGLADRLLAVDRKARSAALPYQDSAPVEMLSPVSKLGDQPQLLALSAGLFATGVVRSEPRLVRAGLRMAAALLVATAAKNLVKVNVDRTRPRSARGKAAAKPKPGHHTAKEQSSFPSGHSAGALAVARAFSREYPEHRTAALSAAGAMALAQIPRCAHYPTDVGAGLVIGWLSELAVDRAAALLIRRAPAAPADS